MPSCPNHFCSANFAVNRKQFKTFRSKCLRLQVITFNYCFHLWQCVYTIARKIHTNRTSSVHCKMLKRAERDEKEYNEINVVIDENTLAHKPQLKFSLENTTLLYIGHFIHLPMLHVSYVVDFRSTPVYLWYANGKIAIWKTIQITVENMIYSQSPIEFDEIEGQSRKAQEKRKHNHNSALYPHTHIQIYYCRRNQLVLSANFPLRIKMGVWVNFRRTPM